MNIDILNENIIKIHQILIRNNGVAKINQLIKNSETQWNPHISEVRAENRPERFPTEGGVIE